MTVEQLKEEADKLGYRIVRKSAPKLVACDCNNRKPRQYRAYIGGEKKIYYYCPDCRKKAESCTNVEDAILSWNEKNEK